jgi:uncharacterized protein (DUF2252 family)
MSTPIRPADQRVARGASAGELVRAHNAGREAERLAIKYRTMRASPFAFLRGTAGLFHLRMVAAGIAPAGPPAWSSGDLHLENCGSYLGDNGLVYFDVNDFDAALLAPAGWDILRLAVSMLIAGPALQLKRAQSIDLARRVLEGYRGALADGKVRWIERRIATGLIGDLMRDLKKRNPQNYLEARIERAGRELRLRIDPKRMLALPAQGKARLKAALKAIGGYDLIDAGRRVAGVSSLGTARYALLINGADGLQLLELKSAQPSATAPYSPCRQPAWHSEADRIVELQRRCQAVAPALLRAVSFQGAPFLLRELQPSQDRLDLAAAAKSLTAFRDSLESMAGLSAWAQLRSSGRQGSSTAEELIAFAGDPRLTATLLKAARAMDDSVQADWAAYCVDYDQGAFDMPRE